MASETQRLRPTRAAKGAGGRSERVGSAKRARYDAWNGQSVRALRRHLGYTQQQLSDELGTRQQTVSEWETGMYQPRGASAKLLSLVAERTGFHYRAPEMDGEEYPAGYREARYGKEDG